MTIEVEIFLGLCGLEEGCEICSYSIINYCEMPITVALINYVMPH